MSLKLFRNTEFAQSTLRSHVQDSQATHPVSLVLLASVWIAILGNFALWQTLLQLPGSGMFQVLLRCLVLALQVALALSALLSLLAWRWTLKPAILLLLIVSALGAMSMQGGVTHIDQPAMDRMVQGGLRAWLARSDPSWIMPVLALLVVPVIWLLPTPVRRLTLLRQALSNLALLVVSVLLLLGSAYLFIGQNQQLMQVHPVLYEQVNPLASLYALARMAADMLGAGLAR
jgi:lipid A ethanolaminephosphotransferase